VGHKHYFDNALNELSCIVKNNAMLRESEALLYSVCFCKAHCGNRTHGVEWSEVKRRNNCAL
jgi:hypothetical protein